MKKKFGLMIVLMFLVSVVFGGATRIIDADQIKSSDHTKTFSFPSATDTLAGIAASQTLTNKTLTSPTMSGPVISSGTASTVPYLDASKILTSSTVTPTRLEYINSLSSNAQTQLDAKVEKSTYTAKGSLLVATAAGTPANLAVGTNGYTLQADSAQASGVKWAAPASVAIGDSITSATAGSVFFGGAAGILAQDNSNLFWDDTNNRLGIGNASPSQKLHVTGSILGSDYLYLSNTSNWVGRNSGTGVVELNAATGAVIDFKINDVTKARIDSSGNFSLGMTPSGTARLEATHDQAANSYFDFTNATNGGGVVWRQIVRNIANTTTTTVDIAKLTGGAFLINNNDTHANNYTAFGVGGSERMRINANGKILLNRTTEYSDGTIGSPLLQINGSVGSYGAAAFIANTTAAINILGLVNPNGTVGSISVNGSSTAFNTSSDSRLKKNIIDAKPALESIKAIKVRAFDWKVDNTHQDYGFIAQELKNDVPEAVSFSDDPKVMMQVDYSKLVPRLTKAIQELDAKNKALEKKVDDLKSLVCLDHPTAAVCQ